MSWRSRFALSLAVTTCLSAPMAIAPSWSHPTWPSVPAGRVQHHRVPRHKLGPLSGKWSGSYSGSFSGTFNLTWQQSGTQLSGTIMVSGFHNVPTSINGTVKGTSISFGTVGSESITYSGSVSGSSMSGSWTIQAGGRSVGTGSWQASRSA